MNSSRDLLNRAQEHDPPQCATLSANICQQTLVTLWLVYFEKAGQTMLELTVSLGLCGWLMYGLKAGMVSQDGGLIPPRIDFYSLQIGVVAAALAFVLLDFEYGISLVMAVVFHELGHVLAYRLIGHSDARFRLFPMISKEPISTRLIASQQQDVFVTLMGAGFSIIPMLTALVLAQITVQSAPSLSQGLTVFGSVIAAYNFVNLLPLWPLDGGRCVNIVAQALRPGLALRVMIGLSAIGTALAFHWASLQLLVICAIGIDVFAFSDRLTVTGTRMPRRIALHSLAAYIVVTLVHLSGGLWLIQWFFW